MTFNDVSHFSKSEYILSFRLNCNKSQTDVLVKPLPVQKSICLLIRPLNHLENKVNTSLHPSLSHTIVLIIFIHLIIFNMMTKINVIVFNFFTARTETLLWRHQVWRHVAAFSLCLDCVNKTVLSTCLISSSYVSWFMRYLTTLSYFLLFLVYPSGELYNRVHTAKAISVHLQQQDKSSDIEQQSPLGDRKYSNTQPQKRGGGDNNTNRYIIYFWQGMTRCTRLPYRKIIPHQRC